MNEENNNILLTEEELAKLTELSINIGTALEQNPEVSLLQLNECFLTFVTLKQTISSQSVGYLDNIESALELAYRQVHQTIKTQVNIFLNSLPNPMLPPHHEVFSEAIQQQIHYLEQVGTFLKVAEIFGIEISIKDIVLSLKKKLVENVNHVTIHKSILDEIDSLQKQLNSLQLAFDKEAAYEKLGIQLIKVKQLVRQYNIEPLYGRYLENIEIQIFSAVNKPKQTAILNTPLYQHIVENSQRGSSEELVTATKAWSPPQP